MARVKQLELEKAKLERQKKEAEMEVLKSGSSLTSMRENQQNVIEQLQAEQKRKEQKFEQTIKKILSEKSYYEEEAKLLGEKVKTQRQAQ